MCLRGFSGVFRSGQGADLTGQVCLLTNEYVGFILINLQEGMEPTSPVFLKLNKSHMTSLSSRLWKLKSEGKNPTVNFEIIQQASSIKPGGKACNLCLCKKLHILTSENNSSTSQLNNREEIYSMCRHRAR